MTVKSEAIKAALHTAVIRSILKMGVEQFKKTSFFGSTHQKVAKNMLCEKDAA